MKDRFGRDILPGHAIAYAGTAGRSASLDFYKVERVDEHSIRGFKFDRYSRIFGKSNPFKSTPSTISDGSRAMIIPIEDLELLKPI